MAADSPRAGWSGLHHGIDPGGLPFVRGWLRLMWWLARPLVRWGIPPTAVTVVGVVLAVDAALLTPDLPIAGLVLVLLSVVCDGLDGAVAVLGDRSTRSGAVADSVADRISDVAFIVVIWRCGAPGWLALLAALLTLVLESGRGRVAGGRSTITVAERPTRVICAALALLCAAITSATWPAVLCAVVWVALHVLALGQIAWGRRSAGAAHGGT